MEAEKVPGSGFAVTFYPNPDGSGVEMRLYVGGADGLVHEYEYTSVNDSWTNGFTFPATKGSTGISGLWFTDTIATLVVTNADGNLEFWWKDTKAGASSTPTHPVGKWTRGMLYPRPEKDSSLD